MNLQDISLQMHEIYTQGKAKRIDINDIMNDIFSIIPFQTLTVDGKVELSNIILRNLSYDDRKLLAQRLLEQQVLAQRSLLSGWCKTRFLRATRAVLVDPPAREFESH